MNSCITFFMNMNDLNIQSDNIGDYLRATGVMDFDDPAVAVLAWRFREKADSATDLIRRTYEHVRDGIPHSADIGGKVVTCKASEVLKAGEGVCFAKSHLLAALLRANGIPCGFCYQRLLLDGDDSPFVLHGLNAVFVGETNRWIRLDARGNTNGINAQFSLDTEMLAFPVRPELGEEDFPTVYADPVKIVIDTLTRYETLEDLWANLPGGVR